jgi:hypothetical protein
VSTANSSPNFYRFWEPGPGSGRGVIKFFEVDDQGSAVQQIDVTEGRLLTPARFTREYPQLAGKGRFDSGSRMRTDRFDLDRIESNRITQEEFELAWKSENFRVRGFHEFK